MSREETNELSVRVLRQKLGHVYTYRARASTHTHTRTRTTYIRMHNTHERVVELPQRFLVLYGVIPVSNTSKLYHTYSKGKLDRWHGMNKRKPGPCQCITCLDKKLLSTQKIPSWLRLKLALTQITLDRHHSGRQAGRQTSLPTPKTKI